MSRPADGVAERLRVALDLFEVGEALQRQRLRRRYPDGTPEEINELVHAWLRDRPGAEFGDHPGPMSRRRL